MASDEAVKLVDQKLKEDKFEFIEMLLYYRDLYESMLDTAPSFHAFNDYTLELGRIKEDLEEMGVVVTK